MSIAERFVGSSVKRVEDRRILTGRGTYVDDVKLPGMLHAVFFDPGTNSLGGPNTTTYGDVDGAFAKADRVLKAKLRVHRHQNVPMETRGSVSSYDPDTEELTVYAATQGVGLTKMGMGMQLG